jgi:hypothetical protein
MPNPVLYNALYFLVEGSQNTQKEALVLIQSYPKGLILQTLKTFPEAFKNQILIKLNYV